METVVRDVRYVDDFFELPFLVQRRVEQLDERLDDHREIFFLVVPAAVDLRREKQTRKKPIIDGHGFFVFLLRFPSPPLWLLCIFWMTNGTIGIRRTHSVVVLNNSVIFECKSRNYN